MATYLREICAGVISMRPVRGGVDVIYRLGSTCSVKPDQVGPLVRMVWELIDNALSHAHPTRVRGKLGIGCYRGAAGEAVIEVADDGVGLPDGFDAAHDGGTGLKMVRTLGQRLGAGVFFDSTGLGLTVRIVVPTGGTRPYPVDFKRPNNDDGRWRRPHEESL